MSTALIASIGIFLFSVLLGIIGYFISHYFKQSAVSSARLDQTVGKLQISVTALNGTMLAQEDKFDTFSGNCHEKHGQINERLRDHGKQIDNHETRIIKIETKQE